VSIFFFAVFLYSWPNPASPQKYLPLSQILEHVESNCPSAINFLDYHCFTTDYFMVLSSHTMMIFQYPVRLPVPHIYKMVFWPFTMHLNLNFHVPHDWCPEYLILLSFNASSHVKSSSIRLASHLAIQHMYWPTCPVLFSSAPSPTKMTSKCPLYRAIYLIISPPPRLAQILMIGLYCCIHND
jgi:hypothetical protein